MGEVVLFHGITKLDLPPDRILENLIGTDLQGVVIAIAVVLAVVTAILSRLIISR